MTFDLSDPTFHDEDKAREHIEASRWPDGVNCQHCGSFNVMRMAGKTQAAISFAATAKANSLAARGQSWSAHIFRCTNGC